MEIKAGGIYLYEKNGERWLIKLIRVHSNNTFYNYWQADAFSITNGGFYQDFFEIEAIIKELDQKVWDKAMNLYNVYISSLESIIK